MGYTMCRQLFDDTNESFRERMREVKVYPPGIMGGPLLPENLSEEVIVKAVAFFKPLGFKQSDFSVEWRFKVMRRDSDKSDPVISADLGYDYKNGRYRISSEHGFTKRIHAFVSAEQQYNELVTFVYNGHGIKHSCKVSLVLRDREGNVVKTLSNTKR